MDTDNLDIYKIFVTAQACHFEAEGREIPKAQQVEVSWLDKIYRQSHPFTSNLLSKSKVWRISPFGRNDMLEQLRKYYKYPNYLCASVSICGPFKEQL